MLQISLALIKRIQEAHNVTYVAQLVRPDRVEKTAALAVNYNSA